MGHWQRASTYLALYRMLTLRSMELPMPEALLFTALAAGAASAKQRQKRRVSSAAAEHTVVPSGDWARCSTLHSRQAVLKLGRQNGMSVSKGTCVPKPLNYRTAVHPAVEMRASHLDVWPVNSATLAMVGYFHRHSWFWLQQRKGAREQLSREDT